MRGEGEGRIRDPRASIFRRAFGAAAARAPTFKGVMAAAAPALADARVAPWPMLPPTLNFTGPPGLGAAALFERKGVFNPSLARAPPGLHPDARYVAAFRVSAVHQCDASAPMFTFRRRTMAWHWFDGASIALLDARLRVLRRTWALYQPASTVGAAFDTPQLAVPADAHDEAFAPPWGRNVFDLRLFNHRDTLWATLHSLGPNGRRFTLHQLRVHVDARGHFRAWLVARREYPQREAEGKNWALYARGGRVFVQAWMGLVYEVRHRVDDGARCAAEGRGACGALPAGERAARFRAARFRSLRLVANHSVVALARFLGTGRARLSTTANLVALGGGTADDRLGIGHLHDARGRTRAERARPRAFFNYSHFFYTLGPDHRVARASALFRLMPAPRKVEFVSGLARRGDDLLLTFGVDDCEPYVATLPMARVRAALRPVGGRGGAAGAASAAPTKPPPRGGWRRWLPRASA